MSPALLFLGRLPNHCNECDVKKFFEHRGRIREIVIKDEFAFVEFEDSRDASYAAYCLSGKDLCGKRIFLGFSCQGRHEARRCVARFGAPRKTAYRIIVENLSTHCSWQDLKDMMREAGEVTFANAHNLNKNEGVVCFANRTSLLRALEKFEGKEINGRRMKLVDDSRRSPSPNRNSRTSFSRKRSRSRSASLCKNRIFAIALRSLLVLLRNARERTPPPALTQALPSRRNAVRPTLLVLVVTLASSEVVSPLLPLRRLLVKPRSSRC
ncbi:hypothetical protein L596_001085 [Steinernema carpocapsae]|uniref:RRM domain-containing protein n=1 Tax=Steinernema carpocapsae TaxID=34508 RepID=A0A4U8UKJ0_STECR|nr:hypothetical protein L596_001085 [Steinernema carpocapsae]